MPWYCTIACRRSKICGRCVSRNISYLLLGVLAFLLRRHGGRGTAGALFLVAAASLLDLLLSAFLRYPLGQALSLDIGTQQGRLLFWRSDAQLAAIFLAGALYLRLRTRQVPGLLPCAALLCGAAAQFTSPLLGFSIGTALFSLAIARLDDAPASLRHALAWKPLAWLGLASYSIYLWQQPLYWFAADRVLGWLPGLALAIAAGILSFYLVERPARRWLNANWHSTTGDRSLARANGFESSGAFDAAAPE
jgi:peptidoglycan/LPS O-acetylase OafA/YrhL